MDLRLQFPPTPEHMADHATVAVQAASSVEGILLDFDVASLSAVDGILGRFHDERLNRDQVGETVFSLGAYIGEVIVRSAGGSWTTVADDHPLGSRWPLVDLPSGRLLNPIGKAFKRLENGEVDSIPYFYSALVEG
jgi:hypothetical protein